jgi:hypothetical protein
MLAEALPAKAVSINSNNTEHSRISIAEYNSFFKRFIGEMLCRPIYQDLPKREVYYLTSNSLQLHRRIDVHRSQERIVGVPKISEQSKSIMQISLRDHFLSLC